VAGEIRGTIFKDRDNTSYYLNPAGSSVFDSASARKWYVNANGVPTSNLGSPTVQEMALFQEQFNNKLEFYDISKFTFETYDGSTWTDVTASISDTNKKKFVGGDSNSGIYIPNGVVKYRITIDNKGSYVFLNALYMYWSSNGHSTQVHIWKKKYSDQVWYQHTSSTTTISSWPGHMYLPFSSIAFHPSGHYDAVRIEFIPNWNGSYPSNNISLYRLQLWGGYPAGKRTIYSVDENRGVSFPAKLTITGTLDPNGAITLPTTGISGAGSGSGLDADLLDGQEGSYYLDDTNYGSWTLQALTSAGANIGNSPITSGDTAAFKESGRIDLAWADDQITFDIVGNSITDTQLAYNTGQHLTTSSNVDFNQLDITDYLTASGGIHVGGTSDPGTDNLLVDGVTTFGSGSFSGGTSEAFRIFIDTTSAVCGNDCVIFEKSDSNSANPDSGISFVTVGNDAVVRPRMTITGAGSVGIGTTSPGKTLHVNGDVQIDTNLYMTDGTIYDANNVETNSIYDPEDAWLYVNDNLQVNGNLAIQSAGYIDDDTTMGENADDWIRLNGYIELKSNTDSYGIVLRDKDTNNYLGITQVGGASYFADTAAYSSYFLKGDGADATIRGNLTVGVDLTVSGGDISMTPDGPDAWIADTFTANTYKSYISFNAGSGSNDPGYIMHETSGTETNEGVLHIVPSDDNAYGDYVSIHGTNDPDMIKLHTSGDIEGVNTIGIGISTERIDFDASNNQIELMGGNVGIGTTNPQAELHVNGDIKAAKFMDTADTNYYLDPVADPSLLVKYKVGIGTTNPGAPLHIKGIGDTPQFIIQANSTQTEPLIQVFDSWGPDGGTELFRLHTNHYTSIFLGSEAGINQTGSYGYNTFLGSEAGYSSTYSQFNTLVGYGTGYNNNANYNTFLGTYSGYNNTDGSFNTFLGTYSGYRNTTGAENIFIGYDAGGSNESGSGNVFIGHEAGYDETGSNKLYIDNSDTSSPLIWGDFSTNILNFNGNVGIGTTNPSAKLEAYGTDAGVIAHYSGNSRGGIWALSSQRLALATTTSGDNLAFGYGGAPVTSANFVSRMFIDNGTGNVGIGTTNPSKKLDVNGDIALSGLSRTLRMADTSNNSGFNLTILAGMGYLTGGHLYLQGGTSETSGTGGNVYINGGRQIQIIN